jgi:hypothetical protein
MPNKVTHKVESIAKWDKQFKSMDAKRKQHGVPDSSYIEKDGKVIVTHTVTDEMKQNKFRQSQEGKDNRKNSTADEGQTG